MGGLCYPLKVFLLKEHDEISFSVLFRDKHKDARS